jgi:hypothetical protein
LETNRLDLKCAVCGAYLRELLWVEEAVPRIHRVILTCDNIRCLKYRTPIRTIDIEEDDPAVARSRDRKRVRAKE